MKIKIKSHTLSNDSIIYQPPSLAISIVTYAPNLNTLRQTLNSVGLALRYARHHNKVGRTQLFLVDNGPEEVWQTRLQRLLINGNPIPRIDAVELLGSHGNMGYGGGHNLALNKADCDFHLILNPDVILEEDALFQAISFMESYSEVGLLAPAVVDDLGHIQYLCKRYPSVLDLLLRGFSPRWLKKVFRKRLEHYELRDLIGDVTVWDIPIISGCFMLFRRSVLDQVNGFSPAYFLYFEDFDISLRVARFAHLVYFPKVRIRHFGGYASKKGWRHIGMFMRSAVTFFNQHGWKWL